MDRTIFFQQCVQIYSESLGKMEIVHKKKEKGYKLADSEIYTKTRSLYLTLTTMHQLIKDIRPQYLLTNSKEMSEDQKMIFDTEIRLKLQRITNQIKNLQDVETNLQKLSADSDELTAMLDKVGFTNIDNNSNAIQSLTRNLISMGDYAEYISVKNETLRTIFSNVVKSLGLKLQVVLEEWNEMHDKRVERLSQLKKSTLSTTYNSYELGNSKKVVSEDFKELEQEIIPQELQQLQEEQHSLIEEMKRESLNAVTQIESSMMDVASMVREIGVQLALQNENISILDSTKDEIVGNVKSGNIVLKKANENSSKRNKTFAYMIFMAGIILLIIDYIL